MLILYLVWKWSLYDLVNLFLKIKINKKDEILSIEKGVGGSLMKYKNIIKNKIYN